MQEAVWGGCQPQPLGDDIMLTPQGTQKPPNMSLVLGVKLFHPATKDVIGQYINLLTHFVYVLYGWGKQFEVAVSLNHDVMTSFRIHISDPKPQNLSK
jgi:hypothetical protein